MPANRPKSKRRFTVWHALLDLLALSATLGFFLYWQKRQKRPPALERNEIPVETVYLSPEPETVLPASDAETPAEPAPPPEPDDLQRIEGIGPKIAGVLNAAGIAAYAQIAGSGADELKAILASAGVRANTSTWPEQARLAAAGDWESLAQLQAQIKFGKRLA